VAAHTSAVDSAAADPNVEAEDCHSSADVSASTTDYCWVRQAAVAAAPVVRPAAHNHNAAVATVDLSADLLTAVEPIDSRELAPLSLAGVAHSQLMTQPRIHPHHCRSHVSSSPGLPVQPTRSPDDAVSRTLLVVAVAVEAAPFR